MVIKTYIFNVVIAFFRGIDIFINTIFGGDYRETISSRMGKYVARKSGWLPCKICKLLNLIDPSHCVNSIDPNVGSLQIDKLKD